MDFMLTGTWKLRQAKFMKSEMKKIIDGEIHLNGVNVNRWIEISKETLER